MAKLKSYHFDLGNSTDGPVGMCASVKARSKAEAVGLLKQLLPEEIQLGRQIESAGQIEYINVYVNPDKITMADIDDVSVEG